MDDCCHRYWIKTKLDDPNRICQTCGKSYFEWANPYIAELEHIQDELNNEVFRLDNELIKARTELRIFKKQLKELLQNELQVTV